MKNETTHGGERSGSGRKKKAKTKGITLRDEESKIEALKKKYPKGLNKLFREWTKTLLEIR